ncbi:MAG: hypothetical protein L6Q47_03040 [Ignavibacteriaceae bacterium]|nr:hypothetical protein [Ignavibacteriaceae bacterium]
MKIAVFFVLFSSLTISQSLAPAPVEGGTMFFYKPAEGEQVNSLSVAGGFNGWKAGQYPFTHFPKEGIWKAVAPLEPGKEVFYKFIINDTLWITDPNAPFITEDEWRNGVITPVPYGVPYISEVHPAQGQRITRISPVTMRLIGFNSQPDKNTIRLLFNGQRQEFTFNENTSVLSFSLSDDLPDGEHTIELSFSDKNGKNSGKIQTKFFADRYITPVTSPAFYDSAVMYEIYIRTFADSDGDGIGDFNGITSRLGYLSDTLGVNTLWLMPWNESTTEHGYNVVDYFSIEQDYGTFEDYQIFLKECKNRGIRVLMDFVINHTDSTHNWFLDAYNNPSSTYTSWYQFTNDQNTDWNHFGVERKMPKLDFDNPQVGEYFLEAARFWLDPDGDGDFSDGIDGFRCDAAKEVPHTYWNTFRKFVKSINPEALILGEVWDNLNYLIPFYKEEFDMLFDYPFYYSLERYMTSGDAAKFAEDESRYESALPAGHQKVRFLSNHDNQRPLNLFEGNLNKLRQALFLIFAMPGTPMIYYGDELLYQGVLPPENVRNQMEWSFIADSLAYEGSMLNFYRELIAMRKAHPALSRKHDSFESSMNIFSDKKGEAAAFIRYSGKDVYLGVINNSGKTVKDLEFDADHFNNVTFTDNRWHDRIIAAEIESDKFRGMVYPEIVKIGERVLASALYINHGGFILLKLNQ